MMRWLREFFINHVGMVIATVLAYATAISGITILLCHVFRRQAANRYFLAGSCIYPSALVLPWS